MLFEKNYSTKVYRIKKWKLAFVRVSDIFDDAPDLEMSKVPPKILTNKMQEQIN
jgi:hypothetical protein